MNNVNVTNEDLKYQKLSPEEMESRGILGRLVGVCADFINPTRNGRKYSEQLWEKVFSNPIMKEKLDSHVVFGELGHPADRTEIDMEKVAVSLAEPPVKGSDGKLRAVFDIMNTPNGRILKALCDYGCKMGVSSRGQGDLITDYDGNESVDPDTYECECFDIVCLPAVKDARLTLVTESLQTKKSLMESLNEIISSASEEDKKIMNETLDTLKLDEPIEESIKLDETLANGKVDSRESQILDNLFAYLRDLKGDEEFTVFAKKYLHLTDEELEAFCNIKNESITEKCGDKDEVLEQEVDNAESRLVDELQEALTKKADLENKTIDLNEKLSVCYAKETELKEKVAKYQKAISRLSDKANMVNALQEKVSKLTSEKETLDEKLNFANRKIEKYDELSEKNVDRAAKLNEGLKTRDNTISKLNESITSLNQEKESLNMKVADLEKDLSLKKQEYSSKIEKANKIVENYKKVASKAVDKYIESQSIKLGVSMNEIKNRLPESYTFNDIDTICEDLQSYKITMNNLPFQTGFKENVKMKITSTKDSIVPANKADEVDDSLFRLAGINKY